jgi:arylsulfatase
MIGANTPLNAQHDGHDLTSLLFGEPYSERPFLYREFSGYGGQQAVWMGKWKGVRQNMLRKGKNPLKIELYDLSMDQSESKDLADVHSGVVSKIRKIMENEHVRSDVFPIPVID